MGEQSNRLTPKSGLIPILDVVLIVCVMFFVRGENKITLDEDAVIFPAEIATPKERMGCQAMVQNFCSSLYSADAQGNLLIGDSQHHYRTIQGNTRNDFDTAWYAFYQARLKNANRLPRDLRLALLRRDFFRKVSVLLARPSRTKMDIESRIEFEDLESQVDSIWDLALDETVSRRLEKRFPGTFKLNQLELPQHISTEETRIRSGLWSEISLALWKGHPNWKSAESDFASLKVAFLEAIEDFKLDPALKTEWIKKLNSVRLTLPGEVPITANRDCISTTRNAFYYRYLNTVTVCAGYFTGGGQILTLAHELAHALDYAARTIDVHQSSVFAEKFRSLKSQVCSTKKELDCNQWREFKENFSTTLAQFAEPDPEAKEVHACLQKATPSKELNDEVITEKAKDAARRRFSDLATNSSFFRLTNEQVKNANGVKVKNPSYLNPCANEAWETDQYPLDSDFVSLVFFTSAYRCSDQTDTAQRLRASIVESKELSEQLLAKLISLDGSFSARDDLQSEGYSSPPTERFADRIGSYAVAKYLMKFPTVEKRRAAYLSSSFWLCERPSLKSENVEQYQALNEFIIDRGAHAENGSRIVDWLSRPIREALECTQDFELKTCSGLESE